MAATAAVVLALLSAARLAHADPPTTAPAPLLDQISQETQSLFQSVRPGLVRVELPPPKWVQPLGDAENPAQKWGGRLDPDVLAKLREAQLRAATGRVSNVGAFVATSQPALATPATSQPVVSNPIGLQPPAQGTRTFLVARPDGGFEFITSGAPTYDADIGAPAAPRIMGIVLDDAGHVLIPIFIEKDALEGRLLNVICAENKRIAARFVGSDRQTNLTVIQLESPMGKPVTLAGDRPPDGSLVMLLSPNGDSGHLSIWTGGQVDRGLLITTSGDVGGFVRMGQFLSGDAMRPIAAQLIQYGKVRRAALGVLISQAETPDGHRAMRIEQVIDHSAASEAGLREGDFILSLAGSPVGDVPSFAAAIAQRDGQTDLQLLRDGQPVTVTITLKPQ
jgi:hypothetical protein